MVITSSMSEEINKVALMPASFGDWQPNKAKPKQIAVLMSGGVDSSVCAYLLKEQGWDVVGITMKIPVACDISRGCCGADAAFVCDNLGLPHYFVDTTDVFNRLIIEKFRNQYKKGKTPNPCVDCNTILKFDIIWDFIISKFGIKDIATGHYASVVKNGDTYQLQKSVDDKKDQSYFLYGIKAEKLANLHFPLGTLDKKGVRQIAEQIYLPVADKPESMELCFAAENNYRLALGEDADLSGSLQDMQGNTIATHKGIANYTIGQRRGLGYAGGEPLYVCTIEPEKNVVKIGTKADVSFDYIEAEEMNWFFALEKLKRNNIKAKIRANSTAKDCSIIECDKDRAAVKFNDKQFAPCPGQKIVLYDGKTVLGGGTISNAKNYG